MHLQHAALLFMGGVLLYFGAEWLVRGSSALAVKLHVRPLVIGLTVVAYGTSAPELVVGVGAALAGRGAISFGNAVGSNIANIGLILGLTSIVSPPKVAGSLRGRELPTMLVSALVVPLMLLDNRVSRLEGGCLVAAALGYTFVMIRSSRVPTREAITEAAEVAVEAGVAAGAPRANDEPSSAKMAALALAGLAFLLLGGKWLVDGASGLALSLGVSERLVGLTIVSVGTSLPELAASLVAARRGHSEIAIGNVIGSNIFNVLLILGASGLAGPLEVRLRDSAIEMIGLVVMTLVAVFVLRAERFVSRREGGVLVALYVLFLLAAASSSS